MPLLKRFAHGELRLTRIEAFSDVVFAIVVTLLVLELKVPSLHEHGSVGELGHHLLDLLPKFLNCNAYNNLNGMWCGLGDLIPAPAERTLRDSPGPQKIIRKQILLQTAIDLNIGQLDDGLVARSARVNLCPCPNPHTVYLLPFDPLRLEKVSLRAEVRNLVNRPVSRGDPVASLYRHTVQPGILLNHHECLTLDHLLSDKPTLSGAGEHVRHIAKKEV